MKCKYDIFRICHGKKKYLIKDNGKILLMGKIIRKVFSSNVCNTLAFCKPFVHNTNLLHP